MHDTAQANCRAFFDTYASAFITRQRVEVIEIGAKDINGGLRELVPSAFRYLGVDFEPGKGVDVVLADPYQLPFEDESADIVMSSSCFEHSEMFWVVFLEILRILKKDGLFYLNAPSNGSFHRYPVDCWRFYPDSGQALVSWARRNSINAVLLESYVSAQTGDIWNDYVAIFLKNADHILNFPARILDTKRNISNGVVHGGNGFLNYSATTEDQKKLLAISQILSNKIRIV